MVAETPQTEIATPGFAERHAGTIRALRLVYNRPHRRRTLKLVMVPAGRSAQPVEILLK